MRKFCRFLSKKFLCQHQNRDHFVMLADEPIKRMPFHLALDSLEICGKMEEFNYQIEILVHFYTWNILFPAEFKIITHWSKWWCSMVEVEYRIASGDTTFDWKALLVPRWSKSWHKQATNNPNIYKSKIEMSMRFLILVDEYFVNYFCLDGNFEWIYE